MRRTLVIATATAAALLVTGVAGTAASGAPRPRPDAVATALAVLTAHQAAAATETYTPLGSVTDADGSVHVRFERAYRGLRVHGGDLVVHLDRTGAAAGAGDGLAAPLALSTTPRVSATAAGAAAARAFPGRVTSVGAPELVVDAEAGRLAWETVVRGWAPDGQTPSRRHVLTDAGTAAVYGSYDEVETVFGIGRAYYSGTVQIDTTFTGTSYAMVDPSHGSNRTCDMLNSTSGPCVTFTDADNTWGDFALTNRASAAADAHFASAKTYDYFKFVHGQSGRTGSGAGIVSRVHYGHNYVNAYYDGTQLTFGDGAGDAHPFTAIDVVGHELGHGYTDALVPLVYSGESGGIDEASSDIWATMVEFYAGAPGDPADYTIGEEIDIYGTGAPLSNLYNPALDGSSHSCWSIDTPPADPHVSAGVGKHFFFDLAEGTGATRWGFSPVCGSAAPVVGIGRAKAEKIWYRALKVYALSTTKYVNPGSPGTTMRAHTLAAAADLYGMCSIEYKTVNAAWAAVNVPGATLCGSLTTSQP
ncbi:M4 family metallopeptidase [Catellatospora sp. KI3]|uniref:M4 family metallopeptidase n=1 Tax=Catellatospora sp. KI3 TaxID=3041620 RepID=UPI002483108C|nr:M4 family metallopeptidase [Catellatospora sp. KI3]MDI1461608.1 M4 family metallopeptidase [Catellatospora sp. KI3]